MNKRILLIGGNYAPELTGIGKYNGEMIHWFAQHGLDAMVLTTYPYYPQWSIQPKYKSKSHWYSKEVKKHGINVETIFRCPHYVPANPTGLKRFLSDISIFVSIFFALLNIFFKKKYDYVLCVAPPFSLGILGIMYRLIRRSEAIYHIQDLQVDAARDLNMIKSKCVINTLFKIEKFILRHSNIVSTISPGMIIKVEEKCMKKIRHFPNWVDVNTFYPLHNKAELKAQFGFEISDKIILYSGAIGEKQGLDLIIHTAKKINNPNIKFVISGMGPFKESLINQSKSLGLTNVYFLPLQPAEHFNAFLNMADVHLVLQRANASDLVLPSKLTTILAVGGVSIVSAKKGTSLYDIISKSDIGYIVEPDSQLALEQGINIALRKNNHLSLNARKYACLNLSISFILSQFSEEVFQLRLEPANSTFKKLTYKFSQT